MPSLKHVSECSGCRGKGCGFNVLDSLFNKRKQYTLPLSSFATTAGDADEGPGDARCIGLSATGLLKGQQVMIDIDDRVLLQLALIGYGMPIVCMMLCVLVFSSVATLLQADPNALLPPLAAATGFIGGLIACQPLSRLMFRRLSANSAKQGASFPPAPESGSMTGHLADYSAERVERHQCITIRGYLPTA